MISSGAKSAVSMFVMDGCGTVRVHESSGETMGCLAASPDSGLVTVFGMLGEEAVTLCGAEDGGHVLIRDAHGAHKLTIPPQESGAAEE